jgi:hypothetical protein
VQFTAQGPKGRVPSGAAPRHHSRFREAHGPPDSRPSGTAVRPCHGWGRPAHSAIRIVWAVPSWKSAKARVALIGNAPS